MTAIPIPLSWSPFWPSSGDSHLFLGLTMVSPWMPWYSLCHAAAAALAPEPVLCGMMGGSLPDPGTGTDMGGAASASKESSRGGARPAWSRCSPYRTRECRKLAA